MLIITDGTLVDRTVALYHVLREEVPAPQLRGPEGYPASAGVQPALAVAILAVHATFAGLLGLGTYYLVELHLASVLTSSWRFTVPS